jgi:Protein of unknown function (DUF2510)
MSQPPGWYDDPQDPSQQRYHDGAGWTDMRRPRQQPGQPGQHGTAYPGPAPYTGHQQQVHPQQGYAAGYQPPPAYPPQNYPPGYGYPPRVPSTPDGAVLSGWWRRVGARIIDGLIVMVVALPLTGYFIYKYIGL